MKLFNANNAPKAIGPYSHAVILDNGFIYISGQLGSDPQTLDMPKNIEEQTLNVFKNIESILTEAKYNKNNVIKTIIFLKDLNDFEIVNNIYSNYFGDHKPARSTIEVSKLPKNGSIEIELVAFK